MLEETVEQDTKNILSCSLTQAVSGEYVLNIEMQPNAKKNMEETLKSLKKRLFGKYPNIAELNLFIRVMNTKDSFPLTGSGKRNFRALENLSLEDVISMDEIAIDKHMQKKKS